MPAYDYALLQAVRVPTGDAVTLGVVLQCRQLRFLDVRWVGADPARLGLDADLVLRAQRAIAAVAAGHAEAGPIARLPPSERFHFLTAVRSTSLRALPVQTGLTDTPAETLDRIARQCGPILRIASGTTEPPAGV